MHHYQLNFYKPSNTSPSNSSFIQKITPQVVKISKSPTVYHRCQNIIMQHLIKKTHCQTQGFSPAFQERSDSPSYFVNNSFRSCLQPKRASVDIKLYFQLHKKILRKAIIQQNFQDNLYVFEHNPMQIRKGFIGNARHDIINHRKTNISNRQKRASTDALKKLTSNHFNTNGSKLMAEHFDEWKYVKSKTTPMKPSVTFNHSAYRKKYRSKHQKEQVSFQATVKSIQPHSKPGTKLKTVI